MLAVFSSIVALHTSQSKKTDVISSLTETPIMVLILCLFSLSSPIWKTWAFKISCNWWTLLPKIWLHISSGCLHSLFLFVIICKFDKQFIYQAFILFIFSNFIMVRVTVGSKSNLGTLGVRIHPGWNPGPSQGTMHTLI